MPTQAPLILVVGMHRSGTSLLGSLLQALGVALPGQLIGADQHNPEGYYEWQEVVDLQERLLIDLDRWWPSEQGCLPLPEGWMQHPATLNVRRRLSELLQAAAAQQQGPWAIKDPRTSRLLPLWLALLAELQIPFQVLLALRDPGEVAQSLIQRDGPITGMDLPRAQALWWRHNLEVLQCAEPLVLDFGAWFLQPQEQLQHLVAAVPSLQPSPEQWRAALQLIKPEHRRSLRPGAGLPLHRAVRRLHRQMLRGKPRAGWPAPTPPRGFPAFPAAAPTTSQAWPAWLERYRHHPAPRWVGPLPLASQLAIQVWGASWHDWPAHLWFSKIPLLSTWDHLQETNAQHLLLTTPPADADVSRASEIVLNLALPDPAALERLSPQALIWDPEPARVLLLRALGWQAFWLDPLQGSNGWLHHNAAADPHQWSAQLGLAPVADAALVLLGSGGIAWDRALSREASGGSPHTQFTYLPGWPDLITSSVAAARAQAGWLQAAAGQAQALVWFADSLDASLACLAPARCLRPEQPMAPAELRSWVAGEQPVALADDRPAPPHEQLFGWHAAGVEPAVAVLVSLYNYADRIEAALASVADQTAKAVELIVVDDASTDQGVPVVQAWMQACASSGQHCFASLRLLRHGVNSGLAVARNTAFAAAQAPWCFVLDADNALYPEALAVTLALTQQASPQLAVVHPLIAVEAEPGRVDDQRSLVGPQSWQAQQLRSGNVVDAMALIRRAAWQAVGGYTHIEGGWEDYDFWCKLVDAGWHGVQCPQVLAVYRSHSNSMTYTAAMANLSALCRTLQQRHPWLELVPVAQR